MTEITVTLPAHVEVHEVQKMLKDIGVTDIRISESSEISKTEWRQNPGYMPVNEGTPVDVVHRNGEVFFNERAGYEVATCWTDTNEDEDIVWWRPAQ